MSEQERDTWLAKFKLWCVLNGISWNEYFEKSLYRQGEGRGCKVCSCLPEHPMCKAKSQLWVNKRGEIFPRRRTDKEYETDVFPRFCLEWVKYV